MPIKLIGSSYTKEISIKKKCDYNIYFGLTDIIGKIVSVYPPQSKEFYGHLTKLIDVVLEDTEYVLRSFLINSSLFWERFRLSSMDRFGCLFIKN